jgi:hypothetical protein
VKKVALIVQKGDAKTTLAVNLAVAAGPQTTLFDLDPQESAVIWADRRKAEAPHVEFLTERRLPDGLSAAEKQGPASWISTPSGAPPTRHRGSHRPAVAPVILRERSAFRGAWPMGKGVTETEPHGKAAGEVEGLKKWVFEQLQMCTPAKVQKTKAVAHG